MNKTKGYKKEVVDGVTLESGYCDDYVEVIPSPSLPRQTEKLYTAGCWVAPILKMKLEKANIHYKVVNRNEHSEDIYFRGDEIKINEILVSMMAGTSN